MFRGADRSYRVAEGSPCTRLGEKVRQRRSDVKTHSIGNRRGISAGLTTSPPNAPVATMLASRSRPGVYGPTYRRLDGGTSLFIRMYVTMLP